MSRLEGKVAVITGAGRGQGRSHAVRLAEEGATIVASDLCEQMNSLGYSLASEEDLAQTASLVEAAGSKCLAIKADARDESAMHAVADAAMENFGKIDVLIVNHGIAMAKNWDGWTGSDWDDVIDSDLKSVWTSVRPVIPHMVAAQSGSIVLTSSVSGLLGQAGLLPYTAAKHGVVGLMRGLSASLGEHWIRVNAICPGNVATDMILNDHVVGAFSGGNPDFTIKDMEFPMRAMNLLPVPWVETVDVSNAVLWLASDEARFVTGVALPVDAGMFNTPRGIPPVAIT
ncbi:mycofactocin-coupled SDR family oxidoreductase [Gordonia insulae]|uniref:(-)-trans-carveol dehydrogenase n=1 Tax=Gordonia insulae TaxID=2420509 RepID=A0A3G8JMW4_9ACTN|nr:mycofactocin-coupled SDR family oxidoreductase [Gordonia insulae]AZG46238.1 (-)-trans-carveol dehydrogenase [Gordonia insulae]